MLNSSYSAPTNNFDRNDGSRTCSPWPLPLPLDRSVQLTVPLLTILMQHLQSSVLDGILPSFLEVGRQLPRALEAMPVLSRLPPYSSCCPPAAFASLCH
jgi:hypothetical protein